MRVVIEVPGWQAVCFSAPVVETYRAGALARHPVGRQPRPRPVQGGRRPRRVRGPHGPLLRPRADRGRGPARPAGRLRRRQRLQVRGAVGVRARPVHAGRRRSTPSSARGCIEMAAGLLRANLDTPDAGHQHRQPRGSGRLRPLRQAVPALQHADRGRASTASRPASPTGARTASCSCRCPSPIPTSSTAARADEAGASGWRRRGRRDRDDEPRRPADAERADAPAASLGRPTAPTPASARARAGAPADLGRASRPASGALDPLLGAGLTGRRDRR